MELVTDLQNFNLDSKSAITIGKFDGIHKGHQKPVNMILNKKKEGLKAVVFTFDPSPAIFFGLTENKSLMTREEKRRVFEKLGVDYLVEYPLNQQTASVSPESFVEDILIGRLNAAFIAVGTDVSFGDKGKGNAALLSSYRDKGLIDVEIIDKIRLLGDEISSSRIKGILLKGDMETVRELIGYPYCITGEVVHGAHIGSELGMPTLNLLPFKEKLLPPNGVYFSFVSCNGTHYNGISNVGYKPTVSNEGIMGVETFLYDFSGDLYGENISVNLLSFRRPEMKFKSLEDLKAHMEADIAAGKEYHSKNN